MPTRDEFLATLHRDAELFEAAVRAGGDLTQPVDGCPDWDLGNLVEHVGVLHRFITAGIIADAMPSDRAAPPADRSQYADWFAEGAVALEATLTGRPDDQACWTFFPTAAPVVGTWVRRQCQELAVHRYDAELAATGTAEAIDPAIAKDGIDEFFDLFLERVDKRRPIRIGDLDVQLKSLDEDGDDRAWTIRCSDSAPVVTREHCKGDVALQGPANALLLALWGRVEPDEVGIEVAGDRAIWARFQVAAAL